MELEAPDPHRYRVLSPRPPDGPLELATLLPGSGEIELEIGFGHGLFLYERAALRPEVVRLDGAARAAKARALECYASQIGALAGGPHRRFGDDVLGHEVRWRVTASPTG